MVKAYLVIDDGQEFEGQVDFDVKPEVGEVLSYGQGAEGGRATVTGFEHRQQVDGFVFVVFAKRNQAAGGTAQLLGDLPITLVSASGETVERRYSELGQPDDRADELREPDARADELKGASQ